MKKNKKNPKAIWKELIASVIYNREVMAEETSDALIYMFRRAMLMGVGISKTDDGKYVVSGDDVRRLGGWLEHNMRECFKVVEREDRAYEIHCAVWDAVNPIYYEGGDTYNRVFHAALSLAIQRMGVETNKYPTRVCEFAIPNIGLVLWDTVAWGEVGAPPEVTAKYTLNKEE